MIPIYKKFKVFNYFDLQILTPITKSIELIYCNTFGFNFKFRQ